MPLQRQTVVLPIAAGVRQDADDLIAAGMHKVHNAVHRKQGSIAKRYGTRALNTVDQSGATLNPASTVFGFGDELCSIVDDEFYSYSEKKQQWINRGQTSKAYSERTAVVQADTLSTYQDVAADDDYIAYVWTSGSNDLGAIRSFSVMPVVSCSTGFTKYQANSASYYGESSVYLYVVDRTTGVPVYGPTAVGAAAAPYAVSDARVSIVGGKVYVFYAKLSDQSSDTFPPVATVWGRALTLSTLALGSLALLATTYQYSCTFDVQPTGSAFWLSYIDHRALLVTLKLTANATFTSISSTDSGWSKDGDDSVLRAISIAVDPDGGCWNSFLYTSITQSWTRLYVSHVTSAGVEDLTPATDAWEDHTYTKTKQQRYRLSSIDSGNDSVFAFINNQFSFQRVSVTTAGVVDSDDEPIWFKEYVPVPSYDATDFMLLELASRVFTRDSRFYAYFRLVHSYASKLPELGTDVMTAIPSNHTIVLVDITPTTDAEHPAGGRGIVSIIAPRQAFREFPKPFALAYTGNFVVGNPVSSVAALDATGDSHMMVFGIDSTESKSLIAAASTEFASSRSTSGIGDVAIVSGGCPKQYDGRAVSELSFVHWPFNLTGAKSTTPTTAGMGHLDPTTHLKTGDQLYWYKAVYEHTDAAGRVHRSAPSAVLQVDLTSGVSYKSVVLTLPTLQLTTKDPVEIVVYRTATQSSTSEATFYRVGSVPNIEIGAYTYFTDTMSDTEAQTKEILYTMGGVLDGVQPSSCTIAVAHLGRVFLAGTDDDTIWYSTKVSAGDAIRWNEALAIPSFDEGRVTGLASLDDKLIIFKRDAIFVLYGEGANELGQNSTLANPQFVARDIGCVSQSSVVNVPDGVMFQSRDGIYLLNRSMQLNFIGRAVLDDCAGVTVSSAAYVQAQAAVRFTVPAKTLNYELLWNTWTTMRHTSSTGAVAYADGTIWCGKWVFADGTTGETHVETEGTYLDGAARFVAADIQTDWIKLSGLQNLQRVWRAAFLGTRKSAHGLTFEVEHDYQTTPLYTFTFSEDDVTAWTSPERCQCHIVEQKSVAIRVRVLETEPAVLGTGEGFTVSDLSLECAFKGRMNKSLPTTQRGT